eukprot:TRINITY_DN5414_c0_g1_i3.p2 TRINITY_DN5414_c0_g1~~TRINITY_DN5414_c0_g1_i3.p2  ORF type:complete len:108 (-),score=3.47 TRINITY_DN5414_c0_g1_i3:264-587(-)
MASFSYNNVTWILGCLLAYFMTDILELYLFKIQKSYKVKLGHHGVEVRKVKKIDYHEKFSISFRYNTTLHLHSCCLRWYRIFVCGVSGWFQIVCELVAILVVGDCFL